MRPQLSDFVYKVWAPRTVITTGGYDRESGIKTAEETGQIIGYGRAFIANVSGLQTHTCCPIDTLGLIGLSFRQPDLPFRLRENIALTKPQEDTFYVSMSERGYTTYPFSDEFLKSHSRM